MLLVINELHSSVNSDELGNSGGWFGPSLILSGSLAQLLEHTEQII